VFALRGQSAQVVGFSYTLPKDHDHSYKVLFSHADMVVDLLRGIVHEPRVD